ncbi:hypothetical protein GGX14DRAFT_630158, partial [Mycena pura]
MTFPGVTSKHSPPTLLRLRLSLPCHQPPPSMASRSRRATEYDSMKRSVLNGPPAFSLLRGANTSTQHRQHQFYPFDDTDPEIKRRSCRRPPPRSEPAAGLQTAITTPPSVPYYAAFAGSSRSLSSSYLNSLMPPKQDVGRGRGQHRTTLNILNSRSASSGSRANSRDISRHGPVFFNDLQAPGSYSPSAPPSPAFEDAATSEEAMSIARRRTFTGRHVPGELDLPSVPSLSAPSKGRRSRSNVLPPGANLGVFQAAKTDMSSFLFSPGDDASRQEFRVSQPPFQGRRCVEEDPAGEHRTVA